MNIRTIIQSICAIIGGGLSWFFGGMDGLLIALCAFVIADYASGITAAAVRGQLSSQVGFVGIAKKVAIFLLVGMANLIDVYIVGEGNLIRSAVLCFYLSNEGISILENLVEIGLPIPKELQSVLSGLINKKSAPDNPEADENQPNK